MKDNAFNRREALGIAGALLAGCGVRSEPTQTPPPQGSSPVSPVSTADRRLDPDRRIRWAPGDELVNTMEFEEQAELVLPPEVFARIAGGDREPLFRVTFRPRMNVPTLNMDLSATIFGETLFTPLMIGPIAEMGAYHAEGEAALVRGAAEAYTGVIVSSRSSVPFEELAGEREVPLWYSVYAEDGARDRARAAAAAGAGAIFITVGDNLSPSGALPAIDWGLVDSIRQGLNVPVAVKGIRTPDEASAALNRGVDGIVISNHGRATGEGDGTPMDALASITDVVEGRVPVLIDGSFRRGADIIKALALGAEGVLMGRPAAWALAAYGSDGVRLLLQLVHEELARNFGMLGVSTPAQLTRDHIRLHSRVTT